MIVIEILLGIAVAWALLQHAIIFADEGANDSTIALLSAAILALGFLGLLLK